MIETELKVCWRLTHFLHNSTPAGKALLGKADIWFSGILYCCRECFPSKRAAFVGIGHLIDNR